MCPPIFLKMKTILQEHPKKHRIITMRILHSRDAVVGHLGWSEDGLAAISDQNLGALSFLVLEKMDCSSVNRSYDRICISQNYHQL